MKQEQPMNINSLFLLVIIGLMGWGLHEINNLGQEFASVKQEIIDHSDRINKLEARIDHMENHSVMVK